MEDFRPLGRAGEGAHGFVFKAMDKKTHKIVALKKICFNPNHPMPKNTMREICALKVLKSPNIVDLYDIRGVESSVVLVMEYLPCSLADVIGFIENPITLSQIKTYMKMFLSGVNFMHKNHIMHRDLKPSNLLISHSGVLKVADFGLARIYKKTDLRTYSHQVATRWYRAPELLYGSRTYTLKIDIWSVGCILGEMITKKPLFPGETDIEQLAIVLGTLGTPDEEIWPGVTSLPDYKKISFSPTTPKAWNLVVPNADAFTLDFIASMLQYNEAERPEAEEALNHDFFFVSPRGAPMKEMPPIDEATFKKIVIWLEKNKIKQAGRDIVNTLSNPNSKEWRKAFENYRKFLGCPNKLTTDEEYLNWLAGYALQEQYSKKKEVYNKHAIQEDVKPLKNAPNITAENPLDRLDFHSNEFMEGINKIAKMLNITAHPDPTITLKAVRHIITERFTQNALRNPEQFIVTGTPFPLQDADLGIDLGDPVLKHAAKILRMLYIQDLRNLQTKANELIVKAQNVTANPKTDTKLGKVGF